MNERYGTGEFMHEIPLLEDENISISVSTFGRSIHVKAGQHVNQANVLKVIDSNIIFLYIWTEFYSDFKWQYRKFSSKFYF